MADRWTIVISGAGPHHSAQATDVDALAAEFMMRLRAGGHQASGALTANSMSFPIEAPPAIAERPAQLEELAVLVSEPEES